MGAVPNVFESSQSQCFWNQLLAETEKGVSIFFSKIGLGADLHSGYGTAQHSYVKRGCILDGTGVWYENKSLEVKAFS